MLKSMKNKIKGFIMGISVILFMGFTGISFLTKTVALLWITYLGIVMAKLDFRIFIPLLTFFWFFTHIVEAFVIQHYMKENGSEHIKQIQI